MLSPPLQEKRLLQDFKMESVVEEVKVLRYSSIPTLLIRYEEDTAPDKLGGLLTGELMRGEGEEGLVLRVTL